MAHDLLPRSSQSGGKWWVVTFGPWAKSSGTGVTPTPSTPVLALCRFSFSPCTVVLHSFVVMSNIGNHSAPAALEEALLPAQWNCLLRCLSHPQGELLGFEARGCGSQSSSAIHSLWSPGRIWTQAGGPQNHTAILFISGHLIFLTDYKVLASLIVPSMPFCSLNLTHTEKHILYCYPVCTEKWEVLTFVTCTVLQYPSV